MSALPRGAAAASGGAGAELSAGLALQTMTVADLDRVLEIEQRAYGFPWSRGNFTDSLAAGYLAQCLTDADAPRGRGAPPPRCLGYFVAMAGVDEWHLLNITVAPESQGQGLARHMLAALQARLRAEGAATLWLEVRESNERARRLYSRWGFESVGRRKGYYPAGQGQREDGIVMKLDLNPPRGHDGLD